MTLFVFFLVALSASLHVLWNALVKQCEEKVSFAWLTAALGGLILLPVLIVSRIAAPGPLGREVFLLAALSGFIEALYVLFLFNAYRAADLSFVYPLSRGIAPLGTLLLGGVLLGDYVPPVNALAVTTVAAGVGFLAFSSGGRFQGEGRRGLSGLLMAIATGCMIAGYHLVDRRAMTLPNPPEAIEYLALMHLFQAAFVTLGAFFYAGLDRRRLFSEWTTNRRSVLIVGGCTPLAYFLIMVALRYGNVTYVTAGRNFGILISMIAGGLVLKERITWVRLTGAALIAAGLAGLVILNSHG